MTTRIPPATDYGRVRTQTPLRRVTPNGFPIVYSPIRHSLMVTGFRGVSSLRSTEAAARLLSWWMARAFNSGRTEGNRANRWVARDSNPEPAD